jgi:quercetin dioxygenase-like cupin family protein
VDTDCGRYEVARALEPLAVGVGDVDRRARSLREIGDGGEVIDVAVGDQDGGAASAATRELEADGGGVEAWIDDDGLFCAGPSHDVAIDREGAEGELDNVEAHRAIESSGAGLDSSAMRSWRLPEIETEDGTRDPVVLMSENEARAVLVELKAGQQLGDHQVKERAWIVVVEGSARIGAGGEEIDASVGTLAHFEPDERHFVSSEAGAKILLLLAPWPGEGHYRGQEKRGRA